MSRATPRAPVSSTMGNTRVLCVASVEEGVPGWRRERSGLGDRRVLDAPARDAHPQLPGTGTARRAHAGDPAPHRPQPPRLRRPARPRRVDHPHRLRRAAGRWRHSHGIGDGWRGCPARRLLLGSGAHGPRSVRHDRPRRRRQRRPRRRSAADSTSITPRTPAPRSISTWSRSRAAASSRCRVPENGRRSRPASSPRWSGWPGRDRRALPAAARGPRILKRLVVATRSRHKLSEIREIFSEHARIHLLDLNDAGIAEQS
jgi:hypothetical protein